MIFVELFLGFLEVGCFSFGGAYGAIALIRDVVMAHGWMREEMLTYMIAVSESTPGPIMVNLATYVGSNQAGFWGAVVATTAVVLPAFLIILLLTALMTTALKNPYIQAILRGLKPCVIGIVLATGLHLIVQNIFPSGIGVTVDFAALGITLALVLASIGYKQIFKKKLSPIMLILLSALIGVVVYAI